MTELATPNLTKTSNWSGIWVLPLLALAIGAWLLWRTVSQAGLEITIHFPNGEGIQAGKTQVLYKGIEIGKVTDLKVAGDLQGVDAQVRIKYQMTHFISKDTRFWLVKPQVSLAGITGLETLVSGFYIAVDPVIGDNAYDFTALEKPPVMSDSVPGLHITLKADRLGSISEGSPVFYRQIQVGWVKDYQLASDQRTLEIGVFIQPEYAQLVRKHSRFWNASGIQFSGGLSGFKLRTESLLSMATGGIAFSTPAHRQDSPASAQKESFTLYPDFDAAEAGLRVSLKLEDVSGLNEGSTPVLYNGVQVGTLKSIDMGRDFASPQAELMMDPRTEDLLLDSSEFWVVRPAISLAGISGLDALLQGNYIAVRFGKQGVPSRSFAVRSKAPAMDSATPGLHLMLSTDSLGSLDIGSPVLFRQMRVGSVQGYQLSDDRQHMLVSIHIEKEFARLVNSSTRFWNASGVRFKGGLSGVEVHSESLQTLLQGGIAFETPSGTAAPVSSGKRMQLYADRDAAMVQGVLIDIRVPRADGLGEGTPLRYRGLDVGKVESVELSDDLQSVHLKVRVVRASERIASAGSRFKVIRPELGLVRTANLDTLVSGPYLQVEPADRVSKTQTRFTAIDEEQDIAPASAGLRLVLSTDRRRSINPGVPVSYREIAVGKVTDVELGPTADRVLVHVLIEPAYASLVRSGSRFWNSSGIGVDFDLFRGASLRSESLETVLEGGIAFATPDTPGKQALPGQTFALFEEPQEEWLRWAPKIRLGR